MEKGVVYVSGTYLDSERGLLFEIIFDDVMNGARRRMWVFGCLQNVDVAMAPPFQKKRRGKLDHPFVADITG